MGKPKKKTRRAKAAGRTLKALATQRTIQCGHLAEKKVVSIEETETERTRASNQRHAETKKRNAAAQGLPQSSKRRKTGPRLGSSEDENLEADKNG